MLKDKLCSLKLSKKLKESGYNIPSLFYWVKNKENDDWYITTKKNDKGLNEIFELRDLTIYGFGCQCCNEFYDIDENKIYPALMSDDLGNIIMYFQKNNSDYIVDSYFEYIYYVILLKSRECLKLPNIAFKSDKEIIAKEKLIIYLMDVNLINIERINNE
jgi:hypothetical protein